MLSAGEHGCRALATVPEVENCLGDETAAAERAMGAAYAHLAASLAKVDDALRENDPQLAGAVAALKASQRDWLAFRESQCDLAGFAARGGAMEAMLVEGCRSALTHKRLEELKAVEPERAE